jgi:hypothetical protein
MRHTCVRALITLALLANLLTSLPAAASVPASSDLQQPPPGTVLLPPSTVNPTRVTGPGTYWVVYQTVVKNESTSNIAYNVAVTYTLDSRLHFVAMQAEGRSGTVFLPIGTVYIPTYSWRASQVNPGEVVTLTVVATGIASTYEIIRTRVDAFNGGTALLPQAVLETEIAIYNIYLPVIMKSS